MKKISSLLAMAALVLSVQPGVAAVITPGSGSINVFIPDNNRSGIQSTIDVASSGIGFIQNVDVILNISGVNGHGFNGDLYAYLTHGDTGFAILLNRVGRDTTAGSSPQNLFGYADNGFSNVRFSGSGATDIHNYGSNGGNVLFGGTWQADGRNNTANGNAGDDRTALLNSFNGGNADGSWTLFVADANGEGESQLDSWALEITGVPEPVNVALLAFGGIFAIVQVQRWLRSRRLLQ